MKITIHQPEHLIWLGLVEKISQVETFVVLDSVQFSKNYVQNRNKIRTKDGWLWLTVPIKKHPLNTLIKDIEISDQYGWKDRHLELIKSNYRKANYFDDYYSEIKRIISGNYRYLFELNMELIKYVLKCFSLNPKILISSQMDLPQTDFKGGVVLEICKSLGADIYVSGSGGKDYLDLSTFEDAGIKVVFQEFSHPIYKQSYEPFMPNMSAIDLLFNYGDKSLEMLSGKMKQN